MAEPLDLAALREEIGSRRYFCAVGLGPLADDVIALCADNARLLADAAKWQESCFLDDATRLREASALEELADLRADAAKWRAKDAMDRALADTLIAQQANDRRWRTVERAVAMGADFRLSIMNTRADNQGHDGEIEVGIYHEDEANDRYTSGPTLAAAVDALTDRLDKETE